MPKPVVVTKVTKAKPLTKTAAAMKETLCVFADKRKKKPLRTIVIQCEPIKITWGRMELLHSCTVGACPVLPLIHQIDAHSKVQ